MRKTITLLFIIINISNGIFCEMFTSQSDLESLIYIRRHVKSAIDEYIQKEENRLEYFKQRLKSSRGLTAYRNHAQQAAISDNPVNVGNPINAFLLVKGLSLDLAELVTVAGDRDSFKELAKTLESINEDSTFPDGEDINGAAMGLIRLQDTYKLDTKSVANGAIGDICCTPELAADDCFELGRQSYNAKDYDYAVQWLTEALLRLPMMDMQNIEEVSNSTMPLSNYNDVLNGTLIPPSKSNSEVETAARVSKKEILDYLHWAQDIKKTLELGKEFLTQMTGIQLDAFVEEVARVVEGGGDQMDQHALADRYKSLCRGETRAQSSKNPQLKCHLYQGRDPYFKIGPLKKELVNINPSIWIYKDVIYDKEIEVIKNLARPRFETAMVVNVLSGLNEKSQTRISKSAWLVNEDDLVISKVNTRIGHLTGLSMDTAEVLQVANYGIGGMYLPHYDFAMDGQATNFMTEEDGNRMATLLFYMSDVEKGGATVFPKLDLTLWPEKGSAAFWFNLKQNGEGDLRTQHAACPVLVGSKWVSNKWIHERQQEFRRPCTLSQHE